MKGTLEVVCGPMFSGKSEELIRRMKRVQISGKSYIIFKPIIDNRYATKEVATHDKRTFDAIPTEIDNNGIKQMEKTVKEQNPEVIAVDEGCFYDISLTDLIVKWVDEGRRVIVAGLDKTYRGEPFGPMGDIMAHADEVMKLKAICMKCKCNAAVMTQRIINGKPAKYNEPTIVIGAHERYEARCRDCHEIEKS